MVIPQQQFTDLIKSLMVLNKAVLKKNLPEVNSMMGIGVDKRNWSVEMLFDINKALYYTVYGYKKTDAVVILRYGKNLKAFTREQIKLGCLPEMISRIIQWINKDSIWIQDQIEYVKELIESDYEISKL